MSSLHDARSAVITADLRRRIDVAEQKARTPGYAVWIDPDDVDIVAWQHVGDPLAEELVAELRDRRMMGGDHLGAARRLRDEGAPSALAFFADVEQEPAWADFEAMRAGAAMARRNPVGMMMGFHGALAATYIDPATAHVMASTARLTREGQVFRRRFWETASGFVGALDVEGMRVGGAEWEKWVRIRLLHTMIRLGIRRSGRWPSDLGSPISQLATAAFTELAGPFRVQIIREFGGRCSPDEAEGFSLMWRWISRIEGANAELLGTTHEEQSLISRRVHQYLYAPDDASREVTSQLLDGLASMRAFPFGRGTHAAIMKRVLQHRLLDTVPYVDAAADLGVSARRLDDVKVGAMTAGLSVLGQLQRSPVVRRRLEAVGGRVLESSVRRGLEGRPATYRPTQVVGDAAGHRSTG